MRSVVILPGTTIRLVLQSPGTEERPASRALLRGALRHAVHVCHEDPVHRPRQITKRDPSRGGKLVEPAHDVHCRLSRNNEVVVVRLDLEEIVLAFRLWRISEVILEPVHCCTVCERLGPRAEGPAEYSPTAGRGD